MKKIFTISLSICLLCGCKGFLGENPETMLSEASAYRTEASLESSVRGILSAFYMGSMYTHDMQEFMQTASCLVFFPMSAPGTYNTNERYYSSYYYSQSPTTKLNNEIYANHYVGISRCNKLIEGLTKSSFVDNAYKQEIEAEAKFLRAVLYFGLVRFYGDVPVVVKMPKTANDSDAPRDPYWKVYAQILDDLTFAENHMREADRAEAVNPGDSRPNKWAAKAFKAAVYAQIGSYLSYPDDHAFGTVETGPVDVDFTYCGIASAEQAWKLALTYAEDVILNGPYELAQSYSQLFRWTQPEDWQLKERIFVLPITSDAGNGQLARRSLPPYPEGTMNTSSTNSNYGRFRPTRFVFQKWCETYGGQKGDGDNNSDIYVSCPDPRFDATFIHTSSVNLSSGKSYDIYPADKQINTSSRQNFAPYFKKYLDPTYNSNAGRADFYFMRFAEMHLIAAEASAELCVSPSDEYGQKAYDYVERLHYRARTSVTPAADYPKWESGRFATKEELVSAVMWERVFEMYGEGHEWFDTHRRGVNWFLKNIIKPFNVSLQEKEQKEMRAWYGETFLFSEKPNDVRDGLFNAFPQDEIIYNTALSTKDQNYYTWN